MIIELEEKLHYNFSNKVILQNILNQPTSKESQRLEFLGDSVINFVITDYVFAHHKKKKSGFLSQLRSYLVSNDMQIKICYMFGLDKYISCADEMMKDNKIAANNKGISNFLETLIGAIYIDSGEDMEIAKEVVKRLWCKVFHTYDKDMFNSKNAIIEYCHRHDLDEPNYTVKKIANNMFEIKLSVDTRIVFAKAKNKKDAEKIAASMMIKLLKES